MKRLSQLVCFYLCFFSLAILFHSCCTEELYISDHGTLNVIDLDDMVNDQIYNGAFVLEILPQVDIAGINNEFGLLNTANALSCDRPILNTILEESIQITSDKEFMFDGAVISADTDFIRSDGITINIPEGQTEYYAFHIEFDDQFADLANFDLDAYTFTISYSSDDDLDFELETLMRIEL